MNLRRPLHGACDCGRNRYTIEAPRGATDLAQLIFNTESIHQATLGPLASFIRVPLDWLNTSTFAYCDDETHSKIRRVYSNPLHSHSKRHFCGYCGTPISYWTEEPRSEADYISLTLGSLLREDLLLLDDLGLVYDERDDAPRSITVSHNKNKRAEGSEGNTTNQQKDAKATHKSERTNDEQAPDTTEIQPQEQPGAGRIVTRPESSAIPEPISESPPVRVVTSEGKAQTPVALRLSSGVPWFDALIMDSGLGRLGNMRRTAGSSHSRDGRIRQEWTIYEWSSGEGDDDSGIESNEAISGTSTTTAPTKRKHHDDQPQQKVAVRKADAHQFGGDVMDQGEN